MTAKELVLKDIRIQLRAEFLRRLSKLRPLNGRTYRKETYENESKNKDGRFSGVEIKSSRSV